MVDIGSAGREIDGGTFNQSSLGIAIENKLLNFPQREPITGFNENKKFPYTFDSKFEADEAFPLKSHMMRLCPRRGELNLWETIFN